MNLKILPKFLRDIVEFMPTIVFKLIDWKEILKEFGPLIFKIGKKKLESNYLNSIKNLTISGLILVENENIKDQKDLHKKQYGEQVLKIYFAQLKNEQGAVLDLSSRHFKYSDNTLYWNPNNFWYQFDKSFRLSLIKLYKGFYFEEHSVFMQGLSETGLTKNLSENQTELLVNLFKNHFGEHSEKLIFKIDDFQESFYNLFHFFLEHEIELAKDFVFLGFYLITLYSNLDDLNVELNVKKCFLEVFAKENPSIE